MENFIGSVSFIGRVLIRNEWMSTQETYLVIFLNHNLSQLIPIYWANAIWIVGL